MSRLHIVDDGRSVPAGGGVSLDELVGALGDLGTQLSDARAAFVIAASSAMLASAIPDPTGSSAMQMDVRRARALRRLRKTLLGEDLFSGPGWEILLYLFESQLRQLRDTIGNVIDGTGIPGTTALRWIERLEQKGLINVRDDPLDGRRRFVDLLPPAADLMTKYFNGATTHLIAA
jgi:DNA-binding MarR family transcriptional regulator